MKTATVRSNRQDATPEIARILEAARNAFFAHGFARTTMDDLARELGMSKKTLYRSFASKEAIVGAIVAAKVESISSGLEVIMEDPESGFSTRAQRVMNHVMTGLSGVSPTFVRDLQRFLPHVHKRIEDVRRVLVPQTWSRLIREGIDEGMVRESVDPAFAAELMLHAVQGLLNPGTLDRLRLTPTQVFSRTTNLLLGGLLTAAGRREYEKTERSK